MLEASRRCRILLPKCTSIKFAALGPDRDFFIAALAEVKIHRNYYEISLRCKGAACGSRKAAESVKQKGCSAKAPHPLEPSCSWLAPKNAGYGFCLRGRAIGSGWQGPPDFRLAGGPTNREARTGLAYRGLTTGISAGRHKHLPQIESAGLTDPSRLICVDRMKPGKCWR
jgi:hypothetical protein